MRRHHPIPLIMLAAVVVVLYAPLLFVVVSSVNLNPLSTVWQGFTGQWYRAAWSDRALHRALGVSIRLALSTMVVAVVLGTAIAVAARRSRPLTALARSTAALRVATPEIVIATGLATVLPAVGLSLGFGSMALAHIAYLSAYVVVIVGARAARLDPNLEVAASDLGATPWRILTRVVLPDLRQAIGASALLVLAFSLDDVALSLALRGPADTTVPVYLFSVMQRRVTPSVHAVGTVIIAAGVTLFLVAFALHSAIGDRSTTVTARDGTGRRRRRPQRPAAN